MFVDLDGFKAVNDRLGHLAGDDVLRAVGERLQAVVRPMDLVARIGGDEFVLMLPNMSDRGVIERLLARLAESISSPIEVGDELVCIGASFGVAVSCQAPEMPDALIRKADMARYNAKGQGSNNIVFFGDDDEHDSNAVAS